MRILVPSAVTAAVLLAAPALATPPAKPTAGDFAACAQAADRPICLLRFAGRYGGLPFHYDIRLSYAPAVIEAAGDPAPSERPLASRFFDTSHGELMIDSKGLAEALEADRRGASPEAALAMLRIDHAGPALAAKDPGVAEAFRQMETLARAGGDAAIVNAYSGPDALPKGHRPSAALARAALADWDRLDAAAKPGTDIYRLRLAKTQAGMGDEAGAQRTDARVEGPPELARGWSALHARRLDQAVAQAVAVRTPGGPARFDDAEKLADLRAEVIAAAEAAGRPALAAGVAGATLRDSLTSKDAPSIRPIDADSAMQALIRDGTRAEVAEWAAKLDATGRDPDSAQSARNGLAAAGAWRFLGETEKARALGEAWMPLAPWKPFLCGQDKSPECAKRMVRRLGVNNDAHKLLVRVMPPEVLTAARMPAVTGLSLDIMDGRGVDRLKVWLEEATTINETVDLLDHCVWLSGDENKLESGQACLDQLLPQVPSRETYRAHPADRRGSLATALGGHVLRLAAVAAREGKLEEMRKDLDLALDLMARSPEQPFPYLRAQDLPDIAVAELRAQGRL